MGRQLRSDDYSDIVVRAKVTEWEYGVFKGTAEAYDITLSELIRRAVFEYGNKLPYEKRQEIVKNIREGKYVA